MKFKPLFSAVACASLFYALAAVAADFGTADEARAMLIKAADAVKANKAAALAQFTKGEGGFKDRDLYPFCGGPDGKFTAHPTEMGKSMQDITDSSGMAFGKEIYAVAKEGEVRAISYMWPRPGASGPSQKVSFVTKIGDQTCVVGYYW